MRHLEQAVLVLAAMMSVGHVSSQCADSSGCFCLSGFVTCSGLGKFPPRFPADTAMITITNMAADELPANVLTSLPLLTNLEIHASNITRVSSAAFTGLTNIELISLNGLRIGTIEQGAFSNLTNIGALTIFDSTIDVIESFAFSDFFAVDEVSILSTDIRQIESFSFYEFNDVFEFKFNNNNVTIMNPYSMSDFSDIYVFEMYLNTFGSLGCNTVDKVIEAAHESSFYSNGVKCSCQLSWIIDNALIGDQLILNWCEMPDTGDLVYWNLLTRKSLFCDIDAEDNCPELPGMSLPDYTSSQTTTSSSKTTSSPTTMSINMASSSDTYATSDDAIVADLYTTKTALPQSTSSAAAVAASSSSSDFVTQELTTASKDPSSPPSLSTTESSSTSSSSSSSSTSSSLSTAPMTATTRKANPETTSTTFSKVDNALDRIRHLSHKHPHGSVMTNKISTNNVDVKITETSAMDTDTIIKDGNSVRSVPSKPKQKTHSRFNPSEPQADAPMSAASKQDDINNDNDMIDANSEESQAKSDQVGASRSEHRAESVHGRDGGYYMYVSADTLSYSGEVDNGAATSARTFQVSRIAVLMFILVRLCCN